MVTAIKVLVKIIKILIIFEKTTGGPLTQLLEKLEQKIETETENEE